MRIRMLYEKNEPLRYTSSLDIQLVWERSFRRARLPLAYSQGFHPQAKIQQALPLPLGFLSRCETVDVWLETEGSFSTLSQQLQQVVPHGIVIRNIEFIPENSKSLQKQIKSCVYEAYSCDKEIPAGTAKTITDILSLPSLPRVRNSKTYDLRPLVYSIRWEKSKPRVLIMELSAQESATARPEEVISALGMDPLSFRYCRVSFLLKADPD